MPNAFLFSAKPRARRQFIPTVNDARLPTLVLPSVGPDPIDPTAPIGEKPEIEPTLDQSTKDFANIGATTV